MPANTKHTYPSNPLQIHQLACNRRGLIQPLLRRKPKTYKTNKQTATTTNEFRVTTLGQEIEKEKKYRKYASCVKID